MAAPSTQATAGISPKAAAAGIVPTALGVVVAIGNYIITGHFDAVSLGAIIGGPSSGVVASIAAYVAKPGPVHTIIADAAAAVGAVEHADPALVAKVERAVKTEVEKLEPFKLDLVDPILDDFPETASPPTLGDAGVAHVDPPAPPDPRDAQIAELQAQLAAARGVQPAAQTGGPVAPGLPVVTS